MSFRGRWVLAETTLTIVLGLLAFSGTAAAWDATNGGDHAGADWIIGTNSTVGGVHYGVGAFTLSNGVTATLMASNALVVTAATVTIDGVLNGVGKGNPQKGGSGKGTDGADQNGAGGGGYGGTGGNGESGYAGGSAYGSATNPTDFGSGGGYGSSAGTEGGRGGGAVKLAATNSGTITVNGVISCNGSNGLAGVANRAGGGGSGGSVWLDCTTFGGTGIVAAIGGNGGATGGGSGGGGGGGRIAVYSASSTFTGLFYVEGGTGGVAYGVAQSGYTGTLYQSAVSWSPQYGGDHQGADWIIGTNATVGGVHVNVGSFVVSNGAVATVVWPRGSLVVTAATALVSGTLTAAGSGSEQSYGTGKGTDGSDQNGAGGGGYGGAGGNGESGVAGGAAWGTPDTTNEMYYPDELGSGGGHDITAVYGGGGGGSIKLFVTNSGTITVDGIISCNGSNGLSGSANKGGGGGSGGSIWLTCETFSGTGTVTAVGGVGGANGGGSGGGGGGGRIAVWSTNSTFNGMFCMEGGAGGVATLTAQGGSLGTLYQSAVSWNAKTGGDHKGSNWVITANTMVGGVHYNIGEFWVSNGVTATVLSPRGAFVVTAATVTVSGVLTAAGSGSEASAGTGKGTDGVDQNGAGGGGYGGAGGNGESGYLGGSAWGNPDPANERLQPNEMGSGGGSGSTAASAGGAGGGVIKLVATNGGTLTVDGVVSCNGSNSLAGTANRAGGGGSGGSLWLDCGSFAGTGTVSAAGGNAAANGGANGGGGGGGRIAMYFTNTTFSGSISVEGGTASGTATYGSRGSVYMSACGWFPSVGGDHGGADWIITNNLSVGGVHWNIGRFAVSNGAAASLLTPEGYFEVTSAVIEVFGTINADGKGNTTGTGTGKNTGAGGGGGYGGAGGNYQSVSGGGPAWGSPNIATATLYPTNFGSGGSGAAGGGVIRLTATNSGAVVVDGMVSANGGNASGAGGGSGGSLWLDGGAFSGTGTLSSCGGYCSGSYGGGGGGGRIAVYFTNTTFTGRLAVDGGSGGDAGGGGNPVQGQDGRRGTITVSPVGWFATLGGDHGGADWILTNTLMVGGTHWNIGRFAVSNGATVKLIAPDGQFAVTAATVEVHGTLTATTNGSLRSEGVGKGTDGNDYNGPGGGGYGGAGGTGTGNTPKSGGAAWGSPNISTATLYPTNVGSGGGCGGRSGFGGVGGGVIHLTATNNGDLVVNGTIAANGGNGAGSGANVGAGGSGGSLWLECGVFSGTGVVSAVGGNGVAGNGYGGGGGGGRIAVHFTNATFNGSLTVDGGIGGNYGAKGTIYVSPVGWLPTLGGDHGGADWIITSSLAVGGVHWNIGRFAVSNGAAASLLAPEGFFVATAATVEVFGTINADGKGSVAGTGGGKNTGTGGGGGYGGAGGNYYNGSGGGPAWGTPNIPTATLYPTNFGSGGSGSPGGGVISLATTNNGAILVNGTISANGGGGSSGGGSGGSIWLDGGAFGGTGLVSVAGGAGGATCGGGGGGRLAAYFTSTTFTGLLTANGGAGAGDGGGAGQIGFYGGRGTISVSPVGWIPCLGGDHGGADWVITNTMVAGGSHYNIGRFAVSNGATVTVISPLGSFAVTAATVEIYGTISATTNGSPGSDGTGKGQNADDYDGPGGGGYGGAGGNGQSGKLGGAAWGTPTLATAAMCPTNFGSGGGYGGRTGYGGFGGGAVRLTTTNFGAMVVDGTIAANGGNGGGSGANVGAGGSGGSLWLECGALSGTGTLSVIGGNGVSGNGYGGGGGGGRISAHFNTMPFTNAGVLTAAGGTGNIAGGTGTIGYYCRLPFINNTNGATGITSTHADLNGTLTSTGFALVEVWVFWGPTDGVTAATNWANTNYFGTNELDAPVEYSTNVTLQPGTGYYYRYRAGNSFGTNWADTSAQFWSKDLPQVVNSGSTNATVNSATLRGTVTHGGYANAWICWGDEDGGTGSTGDWDHVESLGAVTQGIVFSTPAFGLDTNVTYWYRCSVTNEYGGDWSDTATSFSAVPSGGSGSGYKMKISFTNYNKAGTLTDFPVLVVLSNGMAGSGFNFGTFLSTNGYDLRFTDGAETTDLNYDVESWATGSYAAVWVQVREFTNNCHIWATWGDGSQTNRADCTTNGAAWSNRYAAVWHLHDVADNTKAYDASGNGRDAINAGSSPNANGVIAGGQEFQNVAGTAFSYASGLGDLSAGVTLSAWVYLRNNRNYPMMLTYNGSQMDFRFYAQAERFQQLINGQNTLTDSGISENAWYHVTATFDDASNTLRLYVDGTELKVSSSITSSLPGSGTLYIGRRNDAYYYDGYLDELRVSNLARSSNWVWASWLNMASNAFFNTYGTVQALSPVANLAPTGITATAATLNATLSAAGASYDVYVHWGPTDGTNDAGAWAGSEWVGAWTNVVSTNVSHPKIGLSAGSTYCYTFRATNAWTNAWAAPSWMFNTLPPIVPPGGEGTMFKFR